MSKGNLLFADFEACCFMEKDRQPSGGGFVNFWHEGAEFEASFDYLSSVEARTAEAQGVKSLWNIITRKNVRLGYDDMIKRKSDGKIFHVTSKDYKETPIGAGLSLRTVSAEEGELT